MIGRGGIKKGVAFMWIQDLFLFYYRYWVWSEIITSDYSRTSLYGHPLNTDTSLLRTVFLLPSPYIFSLLNPLNMDTPSLGTLSMPPPTAASELTGSDSHDSPRFAWLHSVCLSLTTSKSPRDSQIMWYCNTPLCLVCFVAHAGHVIILLRTVSFKFRLIHVHMDA